MPPLNLPNLYCLPNDVWDLMSVAGVELALDDNLNATGNIIQATTNAVIGATTLNITALNSPLLTGQVLTFDGAGMPGEGQVTLTAVANKGATQLTVLPLAQQINSLSQATDSGVNLAQAARLLKSCSYGTDYVKTYCCGRYNDTDLVKSWTANKWATNAAAKWMATRRNRPCPKSIMDDYLEYKKELQAVQAGKLNVSGIGTRSAGWPFVDNFVIDQRYEIDKIRVQPQLSEGTPVQFSSYVDWSSILTLEW